MSYFNRMQVSGADTASLDAFGRWRTSEPVGLFDQTFQYDAGPYSWEDILSTGTVTHVPLSSSVQLSTVNGTSGNYAYRQSRRYIRYQPGKSQLILMTGVLGARVANVRKRIGYFDALNGCFFEQTGSDFAVVVRTGVGGAASDTDRTVQASWNIDPMNGSGPSGLTLDDAKAQIFVMDLQWLGHGRVRFGLDINGVIYPVHASQLHANTLSVPYMTTGNLPVRVEIENTAAAGALTTMLFTCASVISEGGVEVTGGFDFTANNGATAITCTTRRAILSIRPAATLGGVIFRGEVRPLDIALLTGTNDALVELVYDPTFTVGGGALTWTSPDADSGVEYSVHGDANAGAFTGGHPSASAYSPATAGARASFALTTRGLQLPLVLDSIGANPKALSVVITSMTGNSVNRASINWTEIR